MSNRYRLLIAVATGAALFMTACGKKTGVAPAIIFNADTLTAGQAAAYDPVAAGDSTRLRTVAVRLVCAGSLPDSTVDSMALRLAERLLLVTNVEWKPAAAALLLNAAQRLAAGIGETESCAVMRRTVDSLFQLSSSALRVAGGASGWGSPGCDSADESPQAGKVWLLLSVLRITPEIADLLMEFVGMPASAASAADSVDFKNMVAGLVKTPEDIRREELRLQRAAKLAEAREQASSAPVEAPDNSAAALRYRDQKSIRDSIEKHIPNLRQLYKKHLKINSSLAGKVIFTIRVGAAGNVIGVKIKASEISYRGFLEPLAAYIPTIRFKPIPDEVGAMTFDFPFEFNPEM